MITESTIYWITRMDYLKGFMEVVGGIGLFCGVFLVGLFLILRHDAYDDAKSYWAKWAKVAIIGSVLGLCLALGSCFTPNTKEMCAIKAIPIIVNNEQVQELPNKVVELANEWIEELKPSKDSE